MSKKLINNPKNVVREMLEGVVDGSDELALLEHDNVVLQAGLPAPPVPGLPGRFWWSKTIPATD